MNARHLTVCSLCSQTVRLPFLHPHLIDYIVFWKNTRMWYNKITPTVEIELVDYSTLSDESLIRLIVRTQPEALSALYDRYNRLVFSLALNVVGDRATAEEITLDVFTRIWEKAATYQSDQARVNTWLTRITRNRAIDILRRRSSRPEQHAVNWADVTPEVIPNGNPNPEESAELALQKARVRAAIGQLPAEQQQVLALAYFKGHSHSQIAEILDQPLGTIKTRLRLALQKLRQQLGDE